MPLVEEHWFDEFYRVLVIREEDSATVSVDLYSKIPCPEGGKSLELGGAALRYVEAPPSCLGIEAESLVFLVLDVGTGECELIGARLRFPPEAAIDARSIYYSLRQGWRSCLPG